MIKYLYITLISCWYIKPDILLRFLHVQKKRVEFGQYVNLLEFRYTFSSCKRSSGVISRDATVMEQSQLSKQSRSRTSPIKISDAVFSTSTIKGEL